MLRSHDRCIYTLSDLHHKKAKHLRSSAIKRLFGANPSLAETDLGHISVCWFGPSSNDRDAIFLLCPPAVIGDLDGAKLKCSILSPYTV